MVNKTTLMHNVRTQPFPSLVPKMFLLLSVTGWSYSSQPLASKFLLLFLCLGLPPLAGQQP